LFKLILPSLAEANLPLLLGGTSNHFRTSVLRQVGAWDPFNVTEDADLALRLVRKGYSISVLDSVTYEEANTELGNWMQQRSRWLKGFLQTWLVHMREPASLIQSIGIGGFWVVQATTFGIFFSAIFHPLFLLHALYIAGTAGLLQQHVSNFQLLLGGIDLAVLVAGYAVSIYAGKIALSRLHIKNWWLTLATMPVYWLLMSAAGWLALWQFIVAPFHWNKTQHGLSVFQKSRAAKL
jgi:glycosyltransferase XagB